MQSLAAMTLKRKDVAVQMPTKPCADPISSTAVESDVTIQKLVSVCAPSDIEDAFRYDLAHVSLSLFLDDGNLRPVKRADLGNLLKQSLVLGAIPEQKY